MQEWTEAKKILDTKTCPKLTSQGDSKEYVCVQMPPILGFQVQYVRYHWKTKPDKHWLVMYNHKDNVAYVNDFENTSVELVKKLF